MSGVTLTPFFSYLSLLMCAPSQPCLPDLTASGRCHHPAHHIWSPTPVETPAGPLRPFSARGPITSTSDYVTSLLTTHLRLLIPARKHIQDPTMASKSLRGWPLWPICPGLHYSRPFTCSNATTHALSPAPAHSPPPCFLNWQTCSCPRAFALALPPTWDALSSDTTWLFPSPFSREAVLDHLI